MSENHQASQGQQNTGRKNDRVAIFASGAGTTLDYLCRAQAQSELNKKIALLVTNKADAGAVAIAEKWGVQIFLTTPTAEGESKLLEALSSNQIGFIFLAGYLKKIGPQVLQAYHGVIFNSHPSLLPKYGGKGMFGSKVTEAVLAAKERETGVTIHRVDGQYDSGEILKQMRVPILLNDSAATLEKRVKEVEKQMVLDFLNEL